MKLRSTLYLAAVVGCLVALGALASGCKDDKKPDEPTPTPSVTASASAAPPASASAAIVMDDDTPTEEDFEEEAETTISGTNLEDELTKIEGELK